MGSRWEDRFLELCRVLAVAMRVQPPAVKQLYVFEGRDRDVFERPGPAPLDQIMRISFRPPL